METPEKIELQELDRDALLRELRGGKLALISHKSVEELFGQIPLNEDEHHHLVRVYGSDIPRRILYHSDAIILAKFQAWAASERVELQYQRAGDLWQLRSI